MTSFARNKLGRSCPAGKPHKGKDNRADCNRCNINHRVKFVPCIKGTVYKIPFSCGNNYIGQTGRCLNSRLAEHKRSLEKAGYSRLAAHRRKHRCKPQFSKTTVLFEHPHEMRREKMETYYITKNKEVCVSQLSRTLTKNEIDILDLTVPQAGLGRARPGQEPQNDSRQEHQETGGPLTMSSV